MNENLLKLSQAGVSIWLDDLSRERITSNNLAELIAEDSVVGVTTNPTIFAAALADGDAYAGQVASLKGGSLDDAIAQLTSTDVRDACDLFAATYEKTDGVDGRVSIEVEPGLARDTQKTVAQARQLSDLVGRPQVLIKIPATKEGLAAITETIAAGISVNVTLIFSLERYREVIDAYLTGLERALEAGQPIDDLHSVASFFVSRVDTEVDKRLDEIGGQEAASLKGQAAVANARLAYEVFTETLASERWRELAGRGANPQRPLWASTGVKNPEYDDTMYVTQLVAPDTVNTMPEKTLRAFAEHGQVDGDTITPNYDDARRVMERLAAVGVDLADVTRVLEDEGVDKFVASWDELVDTVRKALDDAA